MFFKSEKNVKYVFLNTISSHSYLCILTAKAQMVLRGFTLTVTITAQQGNF